MNSFRGYIMPESPKSSFLSRVAPTVRAGVRPCASTQIRSTYGADQFFRWLAVDPTDGSAHVVFYDRRNDPQNRAKTFTLTRPINDGKSFQTYAWTTQPFDAAGVFWVNTRGWLLLAGACTACGLKSLRLGQRKPVLRGAQVQILSRRSPEYWKLRGTVIRIGVADFRRARNTPIK